MKKAKLLYIIVGDNPMPNLIAMDTRTVSDASIVCFYSVETESVYHKLKCAVRKKHCGLKISGKQIDNINDVLKGESQMESMIKINEMEFAELNYNGGNKVLSSVAYSVFKNKIKECNGSGILSYFDGENEVVNYVCLEGDKIKFKNESYKELEGIMGLGCKDIIEVHNNSEIKYDNPEIKLMELSNKIAKEVIENWDEALKFLAFFLNRDLKKINGDVLRECIGIFNLKYFKDIQAFIGDENEKSISGTRWERYHKALKGFWLEYYIGGILRELKDEKVIEDIAYSVKKKDELKEDLFEVDIVIYSNYVFRSISVTEMDVFDEAKMKLYEIKARAYQLSGDVNKIAYINLCDDSKGLEREYKKIYENESNDDALIISRDRFPQCKALIKQWIRGGEKNE